MVLLPLPPPPLRLEEPAPLLGGGRGQPQSVGDRDEGRAARVIHGHALRTLLLLLLLGPETGEHAMYRDALKGGPQVV